MYGLRYAARNGVRNRGIIETRTATDAPPQPGRQRRLPPGARLKDLGGKRFAFSKMGMGGIEVLGKIKGVTS